MLRNLFIVIILLLSLSAQDSQKHIIKWNKHKKLQWKNYEAFHEENIPIGAVSAVGIMYETVTQSYEKYILEVFAAFIKNRSYVRKERTTDSLLVHEQVHFDLVEVYARKMRKALQNSQYQFEFSQLRDDISKVFNMYTDSLSVMHKRYDRETVHSRNWSKQLEWNGYIKEELKKLDKYSNPYVTIYLKTE